MSEHERGIEAAALAMFGRPSFPDDKVRARQGVAAYLRERTDLVEREVLVREIDAWIGREWPAGLVTFQRKFGGDRA
jgi:hypothetical protein